MKFEYIRKKLQEANHNVIESYNYFTYYRHKNINDYLQKSLNSAIKANEIITNIIDEIKGKESDNNEL